MTTTVKRPTPKDGRVQKARPDLQVRRDQLVAQVNIYSESITLTRYREKQTTVRLISADEIAHAMADRLEFTTPVMSEDVLWWKVGRNGESKALWRHPTKQKIAMAVRPFEPPERFEIPVPAMVFVCTPGRPPRVFAAKQRPTGADDPLYRSPTFNTYADGRVCPGTHKFPDDINEIPESFWTSFFSNTGDSQARSYKYPDNLKALWEELDGNDQYPLDDLIYQCTVREAMEQS